MQLIGYLPYHLAQLQVHGVVHGNHRPHDTLIYISRAHRFGASSLRSDQVLEPFDGQSVADVRFAESMLVGFLSLPSAHVRYVLYRLCVLSPPLPLEHALYRVLKPQLLLFL